MFHSNHGSISHRFRDRRRFLSKIANFSYPRIFCVPAEGFPLELGIGAWRQKTRVMELSGLIRSMTSSAAWMQSKNATDGRTDGHRATAKTALTHSVARLNKTGNSDITVTDERHFHSLRVNHSGFVDHTRFIT